MDRPRPFFHSSRQRRQRERHTSMGLSQPLPIIFCSLRQMQGETTILDCLLMISFGGFEGHDRHFGRYAFGHRHHPQLLGLGAQPAFFHQGGHVFVDIPDQIFVQAVEMIFPDADDELGGAVKGFLFWTCEKSALFGPSPPASPPTHRHPCHCGRQSPLTGSGIMVRAWRFQPLRG
jgi:hypothetical protein